MASPSLMDTLFQRSLNDVIKALRHHINQSSESAFVSKAIEEIRKEIKSTDLHTKSTALQKLTYFNALHFHDMSWASFHAIECISSPYFSHKKIGYLAISQSFNESTPVILLMTNQLRKDFKSSNEFEVSLALECLTRIGNLDLCRDLTPEVFTLLSSSKASVRKKAIGVVLKVFEKYPDAVKVCFKRIVESLESNDPQIVSAVVGVLCELAAKEPRSYLPLAPEFYRILVDSKNNWLLIKVLKIFAKLAPLEPRLAKRIVEPVCEHMRRTGSKSLMFECIRTVVTSLTDYDTAVKLAAEKIRELLTDDDPNLKYLGLHALFIIAPKQLSAVLENKEVVINSLSDADPNIKVESLRLVMAMVSESNVVEICKVLVNYALKSDPEFCNEILGSILATCSRNVYEIIVDFDWYVSLIGDISRIPHCQKGEEIEKQLIDIGMRVKDVRPELVQVGRDLLIDPALLGNPFLQRVLSAAAWVCGEYVEFSRSQVEFIEALLQPRTSLLPPPIRTVYLQSAFKVLIFCLHSYLLIRENTASEMAAESSDVASKRESLEASNIPTGKATDPHDQNEVFSTKNSDQSHEDSSIIDSGDGQTSTPVVLDKQSFTLEESIVNLLNLMTSALAPLSASYDVEVQERARNVLGFIELVKQDVSNSLLLPKETSLEMGKVCASKMVDLLHDAFCEELGPVSITAQERVPLPDGLVLNENLADLDAICGNVQLPTSSTFSLGNPNYQESVFSPSSHLQCKEESEPSSESTSLLAEHRKRHGLYYLGSEKNEIQANDYPPAHDLTSSVNTSDNTSDLVKLTEQSLMPRKKPSHSKPRPVVVKLDEVDAEPVSSKKPETNNVLAGAVREILLGNEAAPASLESNPSHNQSSKRKGKEKLNVNPPDSVENVVAGGKPDPGNPSSRRSKHQSHRKEKSEKSKESPGRATDDPENDNVGKDKHKSKHRHGRHKSRQKAEVVAQTTVIPDFLL